MSLMHFQSYFFAPPHFISPSKNLLQCSFSTTKKIIFFFSVPPVISSLHPSSNLTVRKGSTVKLSCNASGFPIPGISWQREVSSTLHKITKSIAPALLVLSSSQTKEQKDPKTMSDGTDVRSKSGELSLLQWTFIDQLERGQTWAKKNLRDFSYVIWNLWKNLGRPVKMNARVTWIIH